MCVCVCVCVCARACVSVSVSVSVCICVCECVRFVHPRERKRVTNSMPDRPTETETWTINTERVMNA